MGIIADHTASRRGPLLVGLLALAASTGLLCIGTSVTLLILGRMLQGISAALVWTVGLALLVDTVEKDVVGQAMGYILLGMTAGTILGPLLGGVVYDAGGYYAVFVMTFSVILVDVLLRFILIEKKIAAKWNHQSEASDYGTMRTEPSSVENGQGPESKKRTRLRGIRDVESPQEEENEDSGKRQSQMELIRRRLPPILQLLTYPRILLNLLGCLVASEWLIAFDAVRSHVVFYPLKHYLPANIRF